METPRPMDRLICGDVGYGKTEVALRAAFKAVDDGQAGDAARADDDPRPAALRHVLRAAARLPVHRRARLALPLAARRSARRSRRFPEGKVDILIGTHRLLSRDVRAKDLGLLIVDEEQRFGVKQKELLRQLKLKVDVIALSATPIPRTLQMSLAGHPRHLGDRDPARGPPAGAHLRRRVRRGARAQGDRARAGARGPGVLPAQPRRDDRRDRRAPARAVPEARFEVAHGQMDEKLLEERMLGFLRGDADVLVCTTIIESGIDIPQANTLIVERADTFGLAQLYQIRGRVGRSRERAYAYLLYPARGRAHPGGGAAPLGALRLHRARRRASRSRCATSRSAAPATCSATSSPATWRRSASSSTCRCSTRPCGSAQRPTPTRRRPSRCASTSTSTPTCPADYVPYEQAKIDVHRRIAGAREVADLGVLREELEDRFGAGARAAREPDRAPAGAHQARPGRRAHGDLPRRPPRGDADRARLRARQARCARRSPRRSTSRASRSSRFACPTTPPRASRRSCALPTRCWRSSREAETESAAA